MKYQAIESQMAEYSVSFLCQVFEVSRSGFYDWLGRDRSSKQAEERRVVQLIIQVHQSSRRSYGSPRVARKLASMGESYSEGTVARLMRRHGIMAKTKRKFRHTTDSNHSKPVSPNLLAQDFSATAPGQKFVGDITYIPTRQGWAYLACVMDVYSRKIVGWRLRPRMTEDLVIDALTAAARSSETGKATVFHSDRGSQYAGKRFRKVVEALNIRQSMSRKANCYDNAMIESFFSTLKKELVHWEDYQTRDQAMSSIFEWIECFYNRQRLHSGIGYLTPCQYEAMSA